MSKNRSTSDHLKSFCSQISLHGWSYFAFEEKTSPWCSRFVKFLWAIVVIGSITSACVLVAMRFDEFLSSYVEVYTETRTASLDEVFFPSLVVCNVNPMRKSFMYDVLKDKELSEYNDQPKLSQMWDSILNEFINGWPKDSHDHPSEYENNMISKFLNSNRYEQMMKEYLDKQIINETMRTITIDDENKRLFYEHSLYQFHGSISKYLKKNTGVKYRLFRHLARQWRGEMILGIGWRGGNTGVYHEHGFGTDMGICDWITPNTNTTILSGVEPKSETGSNTGLTLILDAETFDYGTPSESSGFFLEVLHHLDMPLMSQSAVQVSPGSDVRIAITPTIINANINSKRFDPINRQCYFDEEFHFQYLPDGYFGYHMSNCLFDALMQQTIRDCQCHPLPVESLKFNLSQHSCYGKKLSCEKKYNKNIGLYREIEIQENDQSIMKPCLGACKTQLYSLLVTSTNYPTKATFKHTTHFCMVVKKLMKTCETRIKTLSQEYGQLCITIIELKVLNEEEFCPSNNKWNKVGAFGNNKKKADDFEEDVFKYAQNNIVILSMFIRTPFAEKIVTAEKISRISFMSDVGGLLGLFMGFSFVSAVEILFHACRILGSLLPSGTKKNNENDTEKSFNVEQSSTPITKIST